MACLPTLVTLLLLFISQTVGSPCIAFDSTWNLYAFGLNGKDYNAGTQDKWTGSTSYLLVYFSIDRLIAMCCRQHCDRHHEIRTSVSHPKLSIVRDGSFELSVLTDHLTVPTLLVTYRRFEMPMIHSIPPSNAELNFFH